MPHITNHTYWLVVAALVVVLVSLVGRSEQAQAGDAFESGDCWGSGYPLMCHEAYEMRKGDQNDPDKHNLFVISIYAYWDNPSQIKARAAPALTSAKFDWTIQPGPHYFIRSWCGLQCPRDYLYVYEDPAWHSRVPQADEALHAGVYAAVTENYPSSGHNPKTCGVEACLVVHSDIYVGDAFDTICGLTESEFRYVYNHELGHVLGLDDHGSGGMLMDNSWTNCSPDGSMLPTSEEIGEFPLCPNGPSLADGIRCIYHWDW